MIRPININLNAAHPELPLVEATTFTGAPSSVFIRGVPKAVGNWSITAVSVAVTYPDNTTTARAAVESAEGVWVATIPGTATSGRTAAGFKIMADGIDENGAAVTGYVLGFADFSVLSFTPVPAPGGTFWLLRYFDAMPTTPKKGDVAKIDGVLKFYNGSAWEPFAAPVTLDNAVTRTSANGVKSSGIWSALWGALAALPTGFSSLYDWCVSQLAGKANNADVVHTTGDETIGGAKTFTGGVISDTTGTPDTSGGLQIGITGSQDKIQVYQDGASRDLKLYRLGSWDVVTLHMVNGKTIAFTASNPTTGNLAALDANGNPTDSQIPKDDVAQKGNIPYDLGTPIVIDTASSEVVEGETVYYGAATLANRTSNIVQVTAATTLDELRITFPAATSGKVRDFGLRVEIGTGSAALAAPALVPIAPTGETIRIENADGTIPELADGTATAKGVTLLYFSENAPGVFVVKGEQVEEVA